MQAVKALTLIFKQTTINSSKCNTEILVSWDHQSNFALGKIVKILIYYTQQRHFQLHGGVHICCIWCWRIVGEQICYKVSWYSKRCHDNKFIQWHKFMIKLTEHDIMETKQKPRAEYMLLTGCNDEIWFRIYNNLHLLAWINDWTNVGMYFCLDRFVFV